MATPQEQTILEVAKRLSQPRLNKDSMVKLLKQAESALSGFRQSSSPKEVIKQLRDSLVKNDLLQHKDKDVKLLTAACVSEIIRLLAPEPPFSDKLFEGIFRLFIGIFLDLADTASPYFTRRARLLKVVADVKCCVLILDIGCTDLVLEMFKVFFSSVREDHQPSLFQSMVSIMSVMLDEKVPQSLLDVILRNLLKDSKGAPSRLAISVLQNCAGKLEPSIRMFLTSCILNRDAPRSELKQFYHDIILEIYRYAPQTLFLVIPNLTQELIIDHVDVRLEAVHLVSKLLALSKLRLSEECHLVFLEFLKRFSDKSVEVRSAAIECAKACYTANTTANEASDILSALVGRLLDFDEKVRLQAVITICDLAMSNLSCFPSEVVSQAIERLRDKKVSVRKATMQKLLELYRAYCDKCSKGVVMLHDHYEQIPSRILVLCFDKDCKEFRPQNMELVLSEDLFLDCLSVRERTKHWVAFFSFFTPHHIKALNSILSQQRRLQVEMKLYLSLREKEKDSSSDEVHKRILASFSKMSNCFPDSFIAEECFQKLHQMKDNNIFKALFQLVDSPTTSATAHSMRDSFLRMIGAKHPNYEFFRVLSAKCSRAIFTADHVLNILEDVQSWKSGQNKLMQSALDLLLVISTIFPSLFRGSEKCFVNLLLEETTVPTEKLLQILAKVGRHVSISMSDIYPFFERICLEGTRFESKFTVSAIASLTHSSDDQIFSNLCKKLVCSLRYGSNIPTVLQSLGCISKYSSSTFVLYEDQIRDFIFQNLFYSAEVCSKQTSYAGVSMCSPSCKLKVYGIKTLVKSFLPNQVAPARHQLKAFLDFLSNIIQKKGSIEGIVMSEIDKAHLRLAAAKSILRLAARWDLHVSPSIFRSMILLSKDPSDTVRKSLLSKIQRLLVEHAIPCRYACAFVIASSDCLEDVRTDSMKHFAQFIKDNNKAAQIHHNTFQETDGGPMTNYPEFIIVFLIHILAHDPTFPPENCDDEDVYAEFCRPLVVALRLLMNPDVNHSCKGNGNGSLSYILGILRAIKKAEDAVNPQFTSKLHTLSTIGLFMVKVFGSHHKFSLETPRLILLPSTLYKVCQSPRSTEGFSRNESFIDENFVRRMLSNIDAQPATSDTRKCGSTQEHAVISNHSKSSSNQMEMQNITSLVKSIGSKDICTNGQRIHKAAQQKNGSKTKHSRICSTTTSEEQRHESFAIHGSTTVAPDKGKVQLSSSCDSASTKPSPQDSQDLSKDAEIRDWMPQPTTLGSLADETMKISKHHVDTSPISMDHRDEGESLIGHRVRLWSPLDKCFSSGTVSSYDSQNNSYKVNYDNGNVELMHLENEKWKVVSDDGPPQDKELSGFQHIDRTNEENMLSLSDTEPAEEQQSKSISSNGSLDDAFDAFGEDSQKPLHFLDRKKIRRPHKEMLSYTEKDPNTEKKTAVMGEAKRRSKRIMETMASRKNSESTIVDVDDANNAARRRRLRKA